MILGNYSKIVNDLYLLDRHLLFLCHYYLISSVVISFKLLIQSCHGEYVNFKKNFKAECLSLRLQIVCHNNTETFNCKGLGKCEHFNIQINLMDMKRHGIVAAD